jgi:dUTP pyrophosphatase
MAYDGNPHSSDDANISNDSIHNALGSEVNALGIDILVLENGIGLPFPMYATAGASGADLHAAIDENTPYTLEPSQWGVIDAGVAIVVPSGYTGMIFPRSGLAMKYGVTLLNSPGIIDSDYRGQVKILLINHGAEPFEITRGMRIAQLVIVPTPQAMFFRVDCLPDTARGEGGFGSTGI